MATKKQKPKAASTGKQTADEIVEASGVSRETLLTGPGRALQLLIGSARDDFAYRALESVGFDDAARQEGAALVQACIVSGKKADSSNAAATAVVTLNAWDEEGFRLVRSATARKFPDVYASLTDGLAPSTDGVQAVRGVTTLLDRIAKLENGSATEKGAFAAICSRGIPVSEQKRLRKLCDVARGLDDKPSKQTQAEKDAADAAFFKALADVYAWWLEWADAAHAKVTRKRSLITLGLATKKESKKTATPDPVPTPPVDPKK